jgi:iron complex transport system substrate-binding protein
MEAILSLRPDLIVLSMEGNIREDFTRLTHLGVPVFVTNPREFAGIHRSLEQLGTLTGRTHEAELVIRSMRDREDSIRSLVTGKPVRTLLIVSLQPLIVVGRNTFLNQLLELAGSENLAAHLPATYPTYSRETLLQENPDVLIVMSDILHSVDDLPRMFPEWRDLSAIRHGNVSRVDPDLVSRPGPRAIDGLEALYHILHGKHQ